MEMKKKVLAIIGGGPRGLAALESVYSLAIKNDVPQKLNTILFEAKGLPGAGRIYDFDQPDTNWLNYSERALLLSGRPSFKGDDLKIPAFPSFHEWSSYDTGQSEQNVDMFPLRSTMGKYLNERYESIASVLRNKRLLKVILAEVTETDWESNKFKIIIDDKSVFEADELVLTIGHQPTEHSDQMKKWIEFSNGNSSVELITSPYPIENILKSDKLNSETTIALRGFGLAMIDIMRCLTIGRGGKFNIIDEVTRRMRYIKSGEEPAKILPFSLDGLPLSPKPLNQKIDHWFLPTDDEIENFKSEVALAAERGDANGLNFLVAIIAPIIVRVFKMLGGKAQTSTLGSEELTDIVRSWLLDDSFSHRLIVPKSNAPKDTMENFVGMATGTNSISLDFCIGQVWRHCEPSLYRAMSFSNLDKGVVADVIALDERLKRYSYGPPVDSMQQMLALIEAGIINLDFVDDPEITTAEEGWLLSSNNNKIKVDMIVNSVLDPAKLLKTNSPIVRNLLHKSMVKPVHGELGISTEKNACVQLSDEATSIPLAVLGRLSKGTIVGADAVLQCFDGRADLWAKGLLSRWSKS